MSGGSRTRSRQTPAINSKQRAVPPVLQSPAEPDAVTPVRDEAAPGPRIAGVAKPTRITVDLAADLHSFLRAYAQARDVAAADVIRELIRQVRADPRICRLGSRLSWPAAGRRSPRQCARRGSSSPAAGQADGCAGHGFFFQDLHAWTGRMETILGPGDQRPPR
jgi:hypothetical protein